MYQREPLMPFYRFKFGVIHMKGRNLPPACREAVGVLTSDGQPMQICGAMSEFLCDGAAAGHRGTCDRPLCEAHATQVGPNSHLCPSCRTEAIEEIGQRNLFTHLVQP